MPQFDFEKQRDQRREENRKLLEELGLLKPLQEPREKLQIASVKNASRKRKVQDSDASVSKAARVKIAAGGDVKLRRSGRNVGKVIDYMGEIHRGVLPPVSVQRGFPGNLGSMGREDGKRIHDPKTFGHIPGITVGTWWESRMGCSADAIHAPWVAGISGGPQGAYSVALSGGYDDDIDLGYAFTYTGSGGRDLKGTKTNPKNLRTAPQSSDQSFENSFNKALKISSETKKPVRVIRGYKLVSRYAPSEGYRYDGLYVVEKAWSEKGLNPEGFLVCKFAFKRLPNQPPLPVRYTDENIEPADQGDKANVRHSKRMSPSPLGEDDVTVSD